VEGWKTLWQWKNNRRPKTKLVRETRGSCKLKQTSVEPSESVNRRPVQRPRHRLPACISASSEINDCRCSLIKSFLFAKFDNSVHSYHLPSASGTLYLPKTVINAEAIEPIVSLLNLHSLFASAVDKLGCANSRSLRAANKPLPSSGISLPR